MIPRPFSPKQQREARKLMREYEKQIKERQKLSELESARLQVELFNSQIASLLSIHKEQVEHWDWTELASALPPHSPFNFGYQTFIARLRGQSLEQATFDEAAEQQRLEAEHRKALADWRKTVDLAGRVLKGDGKAYIEALLNCSKIVELSELGSEIAFTVHSADVLECRLHVNGTDCIPSQAKSLTATGKLSVKAMPKARFHELYQDYVCGCVLRVAREAFATLPLSHILITAFAGSEGPQVPVLSAIFPRSSFEALDFDTIDASDTVERFEHRGDFKVSRKSGAFQQIIPLTPPVLRDTRASNGDISVQVEVAKQLRGKIASVRMALKPATITNGLEESE